MSERNVPLTSTSSTSLYENVLRDLDKSHGQEQSNFGTTTTTGRTWSGKELVPKQSLSTLASPPRQQPFEASDNAKVSPLRNGRLVGSGTAGTRMGSQTPPGATYSSSTTPNVYCATPTNFEYHLGRASAIGPSPSKAKSKASILSTQSRELVQTPRSGRGASNGTADLISLSSSSFTPRAGGTTSAQLHERAQLAEAAIFPSSLDPLETKRLHRKIEEKHRCLDILAKAPASFPQELRHYFAGKLDEEWVVELLLQRLDLPESVWTEWCAVAATEGAKYPFVIRQQQRRLGFTALL